MKSDKNAFDGFRPSDLRYDNVHILAEYIARAQRVVDSAKQMQESAEHLLQVTMKSAEDCVRSIQETRRQMEVHFNALLGQISRSVNAAGSNVAKVAAEAHASSADYLSSMGEAISHRCDRLEARAEEIERSVARLIQSADRVEESREGVRHELEQLRNFKAELERYERESLKRISGAREDLDRRLSLLDRIWHVFFPQVRKVSVGKAPVRPTFLVSAEASHPERSRNVVSGVVSGVRLPGEKPQK